MPFSMQLSGWIRGMNILLSFTSRKLSLRITISVTTSWSSLFFYLYLHLFSLILFYTHIFAYTKLYSRFFTYLDLSRSICTCLYFAKYNCAHISIQIVQFAITLINCPMINCPIIYNTPFQRVLGKLSLLLYHSMK